MLRSIRHPASENNAPVVNGEETVGEPVTTGKDGDWSESRSLGRWTAPVERPAGARFFPKSLIFRQDWRTVSPSPAA